MTDPSDRLTFFEREYPSANMVLIRGRRPVLVDTGFGSDLPTTEKLLCEASVPPEDLCLIVNTHYHSDHVGGNSGLQHRYGIPIATYRWDANLVNRRDREVCSAEWLDQPVEPYEVTHPLSDGEEVNTGDTILQALHTPGHTLGHVSLYVPDQQILILGDAVHGDDVAWINPFREGIGALQRALESLDKLADLPVRRAYSGHGAAIEDLGAAIDGARRRYTKWLDDPQTAHWHGCKRIFAYALIIGGGLSEKEVRPYLLGLPMVRRLRPPRLRYRAGRLRRAAARGDAPLRGRRMAGRKAGRPGATQLAAGRLAIWSYPAKGLAERAGARLRSKVGKYVSESKTPSLPIAKALSASCR